MKPFKLKKTPFWLVLFLFTTLNFANLPTSFAQIEKGKKLYLQEKYPEAIKALKKNFNSKTRDLEAGILMARCYYKLQHYTEATDVMALISTSEIADPEDLRFLADLEIANENYSEAYLTIIQLLAENETDEKTFTWFHKISDILKWDTLPDGSNIRPVKGINSMYNDYSPYVANNKELWFVSDALGIQMVFPAAYDNRNLHLFYKTKVQRQDPNAVQKPSMLLKNRDYYYQDLAIVEWEEEGKYILTLRHLNDANETVGLYISDKSGKEKNLIPFKFNEKYNTGYATFDKSGNRLIFASDRPGGYGKMDLWYSDWINGDWTEPVNMGPVINSADNETYPSYKTGKLYFASDRSDMGYGALDLYYSSETLGYNKIYNLKSPINGPYDDFAITFLDDKNGYFSSNRKSGVGGDDIIAFTHTPVKLTIPENYFEFSQGLIPADAKFDIYDTADSLLASIQNIQNNAFTLSNLQTNQTYKLVPNFTVDEKIKLDLVASNAPKKISFSQDFDGAYYFEILTPKDWKSVKPYREEIPGEHTELYSYRAEIIDAGIPDNTAFVLKNKNGKIMDTFYWQKEGGLLLTDIKPSTSYELELLNTTFNKNHEIRIYNQDGDLVFASMSTNNKKYSFQLLDILDQDLAKLNSEDDSHMMFSLNKNDKSGGGVGFTANGDKEPVIPTQYLATNQGVNYHDIPPNKEYIILKENREPADVLAFNLADNTRLSIYDSKNNSVASIEATTSSTIVLPTLSRKESYKIISHSIIATQDHSYQGKVSDLNLNEEIAFVLTTATGGETDTIYTTTNGEINFNNLLSNTKYYLDLLGKPFKENKEIKIYNAQGTMVYKTMSINHKRFVITLLNEFDSDIAKMENEDKSVLHLNMESGLLTKAPTGQNSDTDLPAFEMEEKGYLHIKPDQTYKINTKHKKPEDVLAITIPQNTELTIYNRGMRVITTIQSTDQHSFILPKLDTNEVYTFVAKSTETPADLLSQSKTDNPIANETQKPNSPANYLKFINYDGAEATEDYNAKFIDADVAAQTAFVLRLAAGEVVDTLYSKPNNTILLDRLRKNTAYELEAVKTLFPYNQEIIILNKNGEQVYRGLSKALKKFEFILFENIDQAIAKMENNDESVLKLRFEGRIESRSVKPISISIHDGSGRFLTASTSTLKGDFTLTDVPHSTEYFFNTDSKNPDDYIVLKLPNRKDSTYLKRRKEGDFHITYEQILKPGEPSFEDEPEIAQKTGLKFSIPNVYYGFDSYALNTESKNSIDKLIAILEKNPDLRIEIQSHTDRRGREDYNEWLSQMRANSVVKYMIRSGINSSRLVAVGKGQAEPINICPPGVRCTEEDHAINRRTEFMILAPVEMVAEGYEETPQINEENASHSKYILPNIYYGFDSSMLKEESKGSLDSLITLLEINPELRIEIQAHTDSRGPSNYNHALSQRRANAVVNYIARAGIDRTRLFAIGKGDKELINRCTASAKCSEEEHAINRRTEFVILSATAQL